MNVFITDNGVTKYNRYNLRKEDRFDVFKYSLASLSVLPFSKVVIFGQLDTKFVNREQELTEYIKELFGDKAFYVNWRNTKQSEWQSSIDFATEGHESENVMFLCNDDHIFLDYTTEIVEEADQKLKNYEFASFYFSHWPELLRIAARENAVIDGNFVRFKFNSIDSIQVLTPALLRAWWWDTKYFDTTMCRSDWLGNDCKSPDFTCFVPLREQFRHADGYTHVGCNEACPPLEIPPGFFENNIKITFDLNVEARPDIIRCHPGKDLKVVDPNGVDYHYTEDKIPLFWKNRIKSHLESVTLTGGKYWHSTYHDREVEKAHAKPSNVEIPVEWLEVCV